MKILADLCVHRDLVTTINTLGIEIIHAVDKGLAKTSDEFLYQYAQRHHWTILSYDKDFGNTVRFDIAKSYGVILVYVDGMTREEILEKTAAFLKHATEKTIKGKLNLIEWDGTRTWPRK